MLNLIRSSASARCWSEDSLSRVALRAVAVAAVLGMGVAIQAQATSSARQQSSAITQQKNVFSNSSSNLKDDNPLFSSSTSEASGVPVADALVTPPVPNFGKMMGGGQAYGRGYERPRYRQDFTNSDGSMRYIAYIGGGATVPLANASKYLTPNFDVQAGVGYRMNRHFALPVEFDWDQFGFTKQTLDNQIGIYDYLFGTNAVNRVLDGNSHIWSFSLEPTYSMHQGDRWGTYVKAGVGFYHKVANFTLPARGGYGCYYDYCTYNLDHYTSNAPGYNAGFGVTYKFSPDTHARLYAEARYVFVDNQQRYGITNTSASLATVGDTTTNFYPANSNRTEYIPVTVGIRF
ncbi:MAG: hypothetical protein WBY53_04605 [Acidobacteriaceae bacterium]